MSLDSRFSRRSLMAALGAGGALLPFWDARTLSAQVGAFPKRLVFVVTPEGTVQDRFWPSGSESSFTLNDITSPLEPHKDDILIVKGIDMRSAKEDSAVHGAHDNYTHLLVGDTSFTGARGDHDLGMAAVAAGAISVDQYIAKELNPPTKLESLALGVQINWTALHQARVSWTGKNQAVTPEEDPYRLFDTLFEGVATPEPMIDRSRAEGRSILDVVGKDLKRLAQKLGTEDRQRIETHLSSIREIEKGLDPRFDAVGTGCVVPTLGDRLDIKENPNYPAVGKLQMDLLVAAMACDMTRVATLQWNSGVGNLVMSWLGADFQGPGDEYPTRTLHDMTHREFQTPDHTDRKARSDQWHVEQFAYLIEKMKSVPEGDGTMLDNTALVLFNHMHDGAAHSHGPSIPCVIAGSCGGFFKTGRYVDLSDSAVPHNNLLVLLANAMGVEITSFGDERYNGTSLDILRG